MKTLTDIGSLFKQPEQPIDKIALFQEKLLTYLKNDKTPSIEKLKTKTGFDDVNLGKIEPELQRPILAAFAAFEEVFHVNKRLRASQFYQAIQGINSAMRVNGDRLTLKPGKLPPGISAEANKYTGIRFDVCAIDDAAHISRANGWGVNAGEGMPSEIQTALYALITFMHECGHQDESCLADQCFNELPKEYQIKILDGCKLSKNEPRTELKRKLQVARNQFETFVSREFMQYAIEQTEKEYGKKPVAGLIFKPGGKAKSLSLYAATNTKDFYAELFAKVLFTGSDDLTPLGKTLKNLLNSDHAAFRKWFQGRFTSDKYEAYKNYHAKHNGYEKCPDPDQLLTGLQNDAKILKSNEWLDNALKPFGFVGHIKNIDSSKALSFAIQFKLTSNYNIAGDEKEATALQTKLANAVTILTKLRQHRKIRRTQLACANVRQNAQKSLAIRQDSLRIFLQPDEIFDGAICARELCGVALRKWDSEDKVAQQIFAKCVDWWNKKSKLLLMSEYCDCINPDHPDYISENTSNAYAWLDILEVLMEKAPKDFETPEACEKFLDAELAAVDQEIQKAKEAMDSKAKKSKNQIASNSKGVEVDEFDEPMDTEPTENNRKKELTDTEEEPMDTEPMDTVPMDTVPMDTNHEKISIDITTEDEPKVSVVPIFNAQHMGKSALAVKAKINA